MDDLEAYIGAEIRNPRIGKGGKVYATLVAADGRVLINATLTYIAEALAYRLPRPPLARMTVKEVGHED